MAQPHSLRSSSVVLATFALTTVIYSQTTQPAQNTKQAPTQQQAASPVTMTECEGTNNCANWTFLGTQGNGQWPSGEIANLSVERYDDNSVVIRRADSTGSSAGLTAVYTGTRHGDRVGGEYTSSWPGHWDNKSGNWYATIGKAPQGPPSVMRTCSTQIGSPGNLWCWTLTWNNGHYDAVADKGNSGTVAVVSFAPESVVMRATLPGGYWSVQTGKISSQGDSIFNGDWTDSNGNTGHFTATWGAALRDLPAATTQAQPQQRTVVVAPVVCVTWFFTVICGR
jgi:hypothetical protein